MQPACFSIVCVCRRKCPAFHLDGADVEQLVHSNVFELREAAHLGAGGRLPGGEPAAGLERVAARGEPPGVAWPS